MIQLKEIYDGEIISLKKGKKGIVTIKIDTNVKGANENGIFRNFGRKLVRDSLSSGNDCRYILHAERQKDRSGEARSQSEEDGSQSEEGSTENASG